MARDSETQALIDRIEASRRHLGPEIIGLREKLDVPKQLKRKIRQKPWLWFGGSAAAGLLVTLVLRRPRRAKKRKSPLLQLLMPAALAILKPWLKSLAIREVQRRFMPETASPEKRTQFPVSTS